MIELKSVSKQYAKGQNSDGFRIDGLDLQIARGEIFGIIGQSGAGKSTVLRMINLLERPDAGQVFVDDIELTSLKAREILVHRRKIGMIFQHFNLLKSRTVSENVAFPLEIMGLAKPAITARVHQVLELVKLSAKALEDPTKLSGGQRQRVAIARALASSPRVLLSDESTSALDLENTHSILTLLKEINRTLGVSVVLITHEIEVIKQVCQRVAVMDAGRIVETASVLDILAKPKTDLAKRLTRQTLAQMLPESVMSGLKPDMFEGASPLLRFTFLGEAVERPMLSIMTEKFGVEVNVLHASLERVQGSTLGVTIASLIGPVEQQNSGLIWLKEQGVDSELYGYVPHH